MSGTWLIALLVRSFALFFWLIIPFDSSQLERYGASSVLVLAFLLRLLLLLLALVFPLLNPLAVGVPPSPLLAGRGGGGGDGELEEGISHAERVVADLHVAATDGAADDDRGVGRRHVRRRRGCLRRDAERGYLIEEEAPFSGKTRGLHFVALSAAVVRLRARGRFNRVNAEIGLRIQELGFQPLQILSSPLIFSH